MSSFVQDLRYALRTLKSNPGFTLVAIITLALGIGANTAIFSVVNAAILRPLPYPNSSRLVGVYHNYTKLNLSKITVSPSGYIYDRDHSKAVDQLAAFTGYRAPQNLTGTGDPQQVATIKTSWNLFNILGNNTMIGRTFNESDDVPGSRVAILGYALWRDRFASDPNILKREVTLDGANYTIVGVMPAGFEFPSKSELWVPLGLTPDEKANGGSEFLNTVGTLRAGISRQQLDDDMRRLSAEQLRIQNDTKNPAGWFVSAAPLQEVAVENLKTAMWVLLGAVGCVLLIACANVANLLLARATARQKEIAIRSALGASRWRLVRQFLTEGTILGVIGGALGLLLGYVGLHLLVGLLPIQIPTYIHIEVDRNVMLFTLLLGVFTGLLFSVVPSLRVTRGDQNNEVLKQGGRTSHAGGHEGLGNSIVSLQLAFAVILLISAGLLIKTFMRIQQSNPGFDPEHVLTGIIGLPEAKYSKPEQINSFYSQLLNRLRSLPGVQSAALSTSVPLSTSWTQSFSIEGKQFDVAPHAHMGVMSPDYLKTMRIPLLQGRAFTDADSAEAPRVAIVDTNIVRAYFGAEDPIGKHLNLRDKKPQPYTIVGIVQAVKHSSPLETETKGQIYVPTAQMPIPFTYVTLRTAGEPMSLAEPLRKVVLELDPGLPVQKIRPMEEGLQEFVAQPRFNMLLLGIFAALALVLSAVGVYGVMAYSVTQRTHDIGVRVALGAQRSDVLQIIMKQALRLAAIGLGLGIFGALVATRALSSMLFGVKPADPSTFVGITLLLTAITILAGLVPAMRAMRIDPVTALRFE
ncbi:MAG: hypothetical protein JWO13_3444 [Acidobacteriales bacterium]|nr:hypothetical protein [Terriglobales bacterium]